MCRWHKESIKRAAGTPDREHWAGRFAVGLTAMAALRIEQAHRGMPELFGNDGFNPELLLEGPAQAARARAVPDMTRAQAAAKLHKDVQDLWRLLNHVEAAFSLDKQALNIADNITPDGYKKTCCAPANPRESGPFLDAAVVYLFKGYDDAARSRASGELTLVSAEELEALADDPTVPETVKPYIAQLEPLRAATEYFLALPGAQATLERAFNNSIAYIFATAEDDVAQGQGLRGESNCIMCEGSKGRKNGQAPQP